MNCVIASETRRSLGLSLVVAVNNFEIIRGGLRQSNHTLVDRKLVGERAASMELAFFTRVQKAMHSLREMGKSAPLPGYCHRPSCESTIGFHCTSYLVGTLLRWYDV